VPVCQALEDGIFRWPKTEDGVMRLSAAQLSALLEGLDWRRVHEARETATRRSLVDDLSCGEVNQEPVGSSQSSAEYDLI